MADIFISYKSEDRSRVAPLARALEARGYTVWWDLELIAGQKWGRKIRAELEAARCIVVAWTRLSVRANGDYASDWVEIEADHGHREGNLVPALLDAGRVAWTHQKVQYANLVGWSGGAGHPGFADLVRGVARHAGERVRPEDVELAAWETAERARTAGAYREFLAAHPASRFAGSARARVAELEETAAWIALGAAPGLAALTGFLRRFPEGRFADLAEARIAAIGATAGPGSGAGPSGWKAQPPPGVRRPTAARGPGPPRWAPLAGAVISACGVVLVVGTGMYTAHRDDRIQTFIRPPPAATPPVATLTDARTLPAATPAPVLAAGARPGDFEAFRDCADCLDMVALPGGTFTMGSPKDEPGRFDDEDQVDVMLSGFALSRFPVTRGQYAAFAAATGRMDNGGCGWRDPGFAQDDSHPVVCVTWDDAEAYAAWMTKRTGRAYRLSSEAEYEYADRAGTKAAYFWGSDANAGCGYANLADATYKRAYPGWPTVTCDDGYEHTSPVGHFKANPWGLFDISGDVLSWTADCHADSYARNPKDGRPYAPANCDGRVLRGGSWLTGPRGARAALRVSYTPTLRDNYFGFRLARTLSRPSP